MLLMMDCPNPNVKNSSLLKIERNVLKTDGMLSLVQSKKDEDSGYWSYANSFTYNAAAAVEAMQLGNGKWESTEFNSRLQPTKIALGTIPGEDDQLDLVYTYGTTANNGNVLTQTITVPTVGGSSGFTATQTYTYDALNRIKSAEESISSSTSWKQTFVYDRYGNRNFDEGVDGGGNYLTTTLTRSCGSSPNFTVCPVDQMKENPSISTSNNQIIKDQDSDQTNDFDSSGNTESDPDGRQDTESEKQSTSETVSPAEISQSISIIFPLASDSTAASRTFWTFKPSSNVAAWGISVRPALTAATISPAKDIKPRVQPVGFVPGGAAFDAKSIFCGCGSFFPARKSSPDSDRKSAPPVP